MSKVGNKYYGKTPTSAMSAEAGIRADDTGEVLVGVRVKVNDDYYLVDVPLRKLMYQALLELKDRVGVDQNAQQAVVCLVELGKQLASIGPPAMPPPPLPDPNQSGARDMAMRLRPDVNYRIK